MQPPQVAPAVDVGGSWDNRRVKNDESGDCCVGRTEPVKAFETASHADLMSAWGEGSLIQATAGSFGGAGGRLPKGAGLAA